MAISKPLNRYTNTPVPRAASPDLRAWLVAEMDYISLVINGVVDVLEKSSQFLFGAADTVPLNLVPELVHNYTFAEFRGIAIEPDKVAGTITIPEDGLYSGFAYIYGQQVDQSLNEEIHLFLLKNAEPLKTISTFDVNTNQTDDRVINAKITGEFQAGDVLSLYLNATADLGTFDLLSTSFDMRRVA